MLSAVVDTNIFVSALLRPAGPPCAVLQAVLQGRLVPLLCTQAISEYERVLTRPRFGFEAPEVQELLAFLRQQSLWVSITPYPKDLALPDPDDWPFIAAALAVGCPIVTGNTRHFPESAGVSVMTARQMMRSLG